MHRTDAFPFVPFVTQEWIKNSSLVILAASCPEPPPPPAAPAPAAAPAAKGIKSDAASDESPGDSADGMPPPPARTPARADGGASSSSAGNSGSAGRRPRAAEDLDAELSRQLFLDQLQASGLKGRYLLGDDFSHYDSSFGLVPSPAPPPSGNSANPSAARKHRRLSPTEEAASGSRDGKDGSKRRRLSLLEGGDELLESVTLSVEEVETDRFEVEVTFDEDDLDGDGNPLTRAYGEGLAVLIGHLAAVRQPQVQAWLQLKEEAAAADMEALGLDGETWEDLDGLEADFVQTNATHQPNRSWLMA